MIFVIFLAAKKRSKGLHPERKIKNPAQDFLAGILL